MIPPHPFDLRHSPYIALARREDVGVPDDDPVRAAIYAPSTVCAYYADHESTASSTSYAYLVEMGDGWGLVGPSCLEARLGPYGANAQSWRTALDRRHPIADTGLGDGWRKTTPRKYWRLVPVMGLMLQVEPQHKTLRDLLARMTAGKDAELSPKQRQLLVTILRERGGEAHAVDDLDAWDRELKGHIRVAKARRDLVFRLSRLAALDLAADDAEAVSSLLAYATGWRAGRMQRLSPAQAHLVEVLEARNFDLRLEASQALARELAGATDKRQNLRKGS
jgi:hypothetical protein